MTSLKKCYIDDALNEFKKLTESPELFLLEGKVNSNCIKKNLKNTYDFIRSEESSNLKTNALPELIIEDFDLEQIWQQLELQNDGFLVRSLTNVSKLLVNKDKLFFDEVKVDEDSDIGIENEANENEENKINESDDDNSTNDIEGTANEESLDSDDLSGDEMLDGEEEPKETNKKKVKSSIVDDQFFKLEEMEQFLLSEEKKENNKEPDSGNDSESADDEEEEEEGDGDDLDLFKADDLNGSENSDLEGGGEKNPKYADFFEKEEVATKNTKRNKFFEVENDKEENEPEMKSSLELREERLKRKIGYLEDAAVADKPWQLKGEITADTRPQNSLLEEVLDFDLTTRPAPVMTEKTTLFLEDVIKQRIKDKVFDSVERKQKPVETPLEYKKKLVLDQEKSKESLAQIYEKEYLEQREALDPNSEEKEAEEPEEHKEIKKMMQNLFRKLDALSNFHFTPKHQAPELKIVSNLPALNMEEVAPVALSDAALLAPEEVKNKVRGDIMGKSERTDTDKKRERRKKKIKQKIHAEQKQKIGKILNKLNPGMGNKYSKEKARKMLEQVTKDKNVEKMDETVGSKSVKSSTAFFSQLQDEVRSQIKTKTKMKQRNTDKGRHSAKRIKL